MAICSRYMFVFQPRSMAINYNFLDFQEFNVQLSEYINGDYKSKNVKVRYQLYGSVSMLDQSNLTFTIETALLHIALLCFVCSRVPNFYANISYLSGCTLSHGYLYYIHDPENDVCVCVCVCIRIICGITRIAGLLNSICLN